LVGLQRLHHGDQADERIHGFRWAPKIKGNMDIELAIDVMEMAENLDHIIIFSGDGDFRRLVEAVQRKGVRVSVVSTIESQPPMIADELRRQADEFIELSDIQEQISAPAVPRVR
jgi:uncharacterized LabA/DUF88 family protein